MKAVYAIAAAASLAGCASPPHSASAYTYYQTQQEQDVRTGTVESVRAVTILNPETGTGVMTGAALGGIAGSYAGSGRGSVATSIMGALAGGLLGQRIEGGAAHRPGLEITVKLDNGELRAITQEADEQFRPGERVRLLSDGNITRVTH